MGETKVRRPPPVAPCPVRAANVKSEAILETSKNLKLHNRGNDLLHRQMTQHGGGVKLVVCPSLHFHASNVRSVVGGSSYPDGSAGVVGRCNGLRMRSPKPRPVAVSPKPQALGRFSEASSRTDQCLGVAGEAKLTESGSRRHSRGNCQGIASRSYSAS